MDGKNNVACALPVRVQNLRVGDATVDFLVRREATSTMDEILRKTGSVEIVETI
jgi:hypothetical protein